ncbi:long-chain acyl-CoA dehydrogenase [Hyphomonas adhaerens MHS-3]|uniref:Long-chain acyl-CoA dehydrogenase n=1 Tax=Hyphomonas adhaerens MHS-3 TaxID=1280949 RepID=A0A069E9M8_9PROT|nr:acyl-CoA dehydrogenase family protein [Hyphomonas adhaerens]KCZ86156.1 long-chain acyl-CoA dehydrogenase [Hyphomonas adhaerens MHS-3]
MPIPVDRQGQSEMHTIFRDSVRRFFASELDLDTWERDRLTPRSFWLSAGKAGLLCPTVPEAYGGLGLDFSYNAIVTEELTYAGSSASLPLQSDIIADYFVHLGTEEQKTKYLPGMVDGSLIAAIAMTEPGAGSDLQSIRTRAVRDGDEYVISGAKTYISSGQHADVVIVAAKTDPEAGAKGVSLLIVDADRPGFSRGRKLNKIGQHSADTSELFFDEVRVPASALLGQEGGGFSAIMTLMPQERLSQAIMGQAGAQRALDETIGFTTDRRAFGQAVFDFQNTQFVLAEIAASLQVGWSHLDWAIQRHVAGGLTATEASAAKLWHTEMQWSALDKCLQLHGGAGYMEEYPIARMWRDARVQRIYGGTSEILKLVIGRSLKR